MVLDEEEEIKTITFLDDENPSYILLITYDHQDQLTISRILNIKQEQVAQFQQMKLDREQRLNLANLVEDRIEGGHLSVPRNFMDNYCFSLDENDSESLIRNDLAITYAPSRKTQEEKFKGTYASHGLEAGATEGPAFSFKDEKIYEIFEFKEQKIKDQFSKVYYFNKDARRKILYTSNIVNHSQCYFIKQKLATDKRPSSR